MNTFTKFDYDHAKEHLQGLINQIYETGNILELESNLEEVLACFGMKIPKGDPVLIKKKEKSPLLEDWMDFNKNYLKSLAIAQ